MTVWRVARSLTSALSSWMRADRKSTRLNSSHSSNSYAVLCLKKKTPVQAPMQTVPSQPQIMELTRSLKHAGAPAPATMIVCLSARSYHRFEQVEHPADFAARG